ncbi:MAG: VOC family protein [Propionibacteriaceae bacterium]
MASLATPYLSFRSTAREALEFYRDVFGGELVMSTFGEFGMPDVAADQIMHGQLETSAGFVLMGSDVPESMPHTGGSTLTVCLNGDDVDQLHGYWEKLIQGADVSTPLEKMMWGDEYGACTDRFGIPWMINITLPKE